MIIRTNCYDYILIEQFDLCSISGESYICVHFYIRYRLWIWMHIYLLQFMKQISLNQFAGESEGNLFDLMAPKCFVCSKKRTFKKPIIINELFGCGHLICIDCLRRHCQEWLDKGCTEIPCPVDRTLLSRKLILSVLDGGRAQKYALLVQQNPGSRPAERQKTMTVTVSSTY